MRRLFQVIRRISEAADPGLVATQAEPEHARPDQAPTAVLPVVYRPEDHPKAGKWESPNAIHPLPPGRHCANCTGLEQTIELLRQERAELRARLIGYELAAHRKQRLGPSEQLP